MPYATAFDTTAPYNLVSNPIISGFTGGFVTGGFPANVQRKALHVQNVGSGGPLFIAFGTGPASSTNFNRILAAAPSHLGAGGVFTDFSWTGQLSYSGAPFVYAMVWEAQ